MIMMTTIITIISNPPVTDPGSVENHSAENDACEPGQTLSNQGSYTLGKPSFANSAVFFNIVQTAFDPLAQHYTIFLYYLDWEIQHRVGTPYRRVIFRNGAPEATIYQIQSVFLQINGCSHVSSHPKKIGQPQSLFRGVQAFFRGYIVSQKTWMIHKKCG